MNKNISVVLLGAGSSRRFKSSQIKQNVKINKVSILNHSRLFFNKYFPESKIFIVSNSRHIVSFRVIRKYVICYLLVARYILFSIIL